jgi:hypothetical protein
MPEDTIVTRTESFIESLKKRPIWAAMLGLWFVCATFLIHTSWGRAEVYAKVEDYNVRARSIWMIEKKLTLIEQTMTLIWSNAADSKQFYFAKILPYLGHTIPKTTLDEGLHSSEEVRNGIDAELEVLASLHIEDASFDPFIQGFREDMENLRADFNGQISAYQGLLIGRHTVRVSEVSGGSFDAAELRVQAFKERKKEKDLEYQAELDAKRVEADQYRFKLYVLVPAASFYIGGLAVIVLLRWKRQVVEAKNAPPGDLDHAGGSSADIQPPDYEPPGGA